MSRTAPVGVQGHGWSWGGVNIEGTRIKEALRPVRKERDKCLVGVRGKWYDVTNFVRNHPGGDVLTEFAGRDATAQFMAYHDEVKVLGKRKPVGTYEWDESAPGGDAMEADYLRLGYEFERLGYFKPDLAWTTSRIGLAFAFLASSLLCVWRLVSLQGDAPVSLVIGAVALAGFWQQSGFLMHDMMHNQHTHNRKIDQAFGWFFGGVCFGVSGRWWSCLLYTSDAADEEDSVDLGGRRIIKKKKRL
eukprot:TRINITY_DN27172_c0_g1_i1.p1 TRINITY_DN27172_c0_g1~~TRINITY_DN27172_c0_g1_i1.p1  ORF type:complete len:246 (+),score=64.16 TRINITY_DN27172_c0_g1_i1:153-890(+)